MIPHTANTHEHCPKPPPPAHLHGLEDAIHLLHQLHRLKQVVAHVVAVPVEHLRGRGRSWYKRSTTKVGVL